MAGQNDSAAEDSLACGPAPDSPSALVRKPGPGDVRRVGRRLPDEHRPPADHHPLRLEERTLTATSSRSPDSDRWRRSNRSTSFMDEKQAAGRAAIAWALPALAEQSEAGRILARLQLFHSGHRRGLGIEPLSQSQGCFDVAPVVVE